MMYTARGVWPCKGVTSKQGLLATRELASKIATLLRPAVLRPGSAGSNDIAAAAHIKLAGMGAGRTIVSIPNVRLFDVR
jgi:hypothetical protein